ncbi:Centromere protein S [Dispira simplex]|nr:Centromere protein S [Dispira simplex]
MSLDSPSRTSYAPNQQLRAAVWHTVDRICNEESESLGVTITPRFVAGLGDVVCKQLELMAGDLTMFAQHRKKAVINTDDVKLCARKNGQLLQALTRAAEQLAVEESETSKGKGRGKK